MTRRERLMATLRGEPVDRPAMNFYELNGLTHNTGDPDPANIFNHPSWKPLLDLTREKTDLILMSHVGFPIEPPDPMKELCQVEEWLDDNGSRHVRRTYTLPSGRVLTDYMRRDREINTWWHLQHLLKDLDDFREWLDIPLPEAPVVKPDPAPVHEAEALVGDRGIVMLDTSDPLCMVAPRFHMEDYTIFALTEPDLFRRALDRAAAWLFPRIEAICEACPGHLWRIYGPEYASPPYLPPRLFREYVVNYVTPMVKMIQKTGGYARIHSHGRLKDILGLIAETGCDGLDPIEPPPQGDMPLKDVRAQVGRQMVLFGNLEVSDIENLPTDQFRERVRTALREGTAGEGRGLVVMPSAAPYGREITALTQHNYEAIVEEVEAWQG